VLLVPSGSADAKERSPDEKSTIGVNHPANGVDVAPLLVETFGGFGPELLELLRGAAEFKCNKLSAAEYDETTWSARTWLTFAMQRVSVAVHKAVAREVSDALGLSAAVDPRGVPRD
jgi:hypothetical protein